MIDMAELLDCSKLNCCGGKSGGGANDCNACLKSISDLVAQKKLPEEALTNLDQSLCFACRSCEVNYRPWDCCVLPCIFIDSPGHDPDTITSIDTETTLSAVICFCGPGAAALMCAGLSLDACWYAESIGPAREYDFCAGVNEPPLVLPPIKSGTTTQLGKFCYVLDLKIPAGYIQQPSVYAFSAKITLGCQEHPLMNAFVVGGFVEFTKP
jgi:hypothetical protein